MFVLLISLYLVMLVYRCGYKVSRTVGKQWSFCDNAGLEGRGKHCYRWRYPNTNHPRPPRAGSVPGFVTASQDQHPEGGRMDDIQHNCGKYATDTSCDRCSVGTTHTGSSYEGRLTKCCLFSPICTHTTQFYVLNLKTSQPLNKFRWKFTETKFPTSFPSQWGNLVFFAKITPTRK